MSNVNEPSEDGPSPDRFFVTIKAPNRRRVRDLAALDLDLHATRGEGDGVGVDGLLTLQEIADVVRSGYPVLVSQDAGERAAAQNVIEFDEWLEAQRQDLGRIGES